MKEPEKWIFHKGSACGPTEAMQPELNPEWVKQQQQQQEDRYESFTRQADRH